MRNLFRTSILIAPIVIFLLVSSLQSHVASASVAGSPTLVLSEGETILLPDLKLPWSPEWNGIVKFSGGPHAWNNDVFTSKYHYGNGSGIDFSAGGKSFLVTAMATGNLIAADCGYSGLGCIIAIKHDTGSSVAIYGHLNEGSSEFKRWKYRLDISSNVKVYRGWAIGMSGMSGDGAAGNHLHVELRDGSSNSYPFGQPIGWETMELINGQIDSYWIYGYAKADPINPNKAYKDHKDFYNYDGVAVKGYERKLIRDFKYVDVPGVYNSDAVTYVGSNFTWPRTDCTNDCEIQTDPGTQFARSGSGGFWTSGSLFQTYQSSLGTSSTGSSHGVLESTNEAPKILSDNAAFVSDLTIPDGTSVSPGQSLTKTWRMQNTGKTTWGSGYQLAFISGEQMGAPAAIDVPATAPGQTADLSINFTAPDGDGDHKGYWRLRNPQGTYFGDQIWVEVNVVSSNQGGGRITMFDVSPSSPSEATAVHVVGRVRAFPEFRSMRFKFGNDVHEMTNFKQVGDQLEISADWQTGSLPRGNYTLMLEMATKGDPDWANPERQIKTYSLIGDPVPVGHPPDRPILESPYDYYMKDASGASAPVRMCAHPVSDPDGDPVQYLFEVKSNEHGIQQSGWLSSNCWEPTLAPALYDWKAKAGDGANESDWSNETWHFTVAGGGVSIGDINLFNLNTNNTHICVEITYGGIQAPEVYGFINKAPDGSDSGEWRLLDHYGPNTTPDCTQPNVHGWWIRSPEYETGNHLIRIDATKRDSGESDSKFSSYNIAYIKPPDPVILEPATHLDNGTWWNDYEINFSWRIPLRTVSQELRVSTQSDIWNDPSPVLSKTFGGTKDSYTHTFSQDYAKLYWGIRATNSAGYGQSPNDVWFGIDHVKPTCTVQTLPATSVESVFQVIWAGTDNAADLRSFDIQYRDSNRGGWNNWLVNIPANKTFDLFTGQPGHSYKFRCRATDNAGNRGKYPTKADTSTLIDPSARPPAPWWDNNYEEKRNLVILNNMSDVTMPVGYPIQLHFDNGTTPTASEIYNSSLSSPKCNDLRVIFNDATEINRLIDRCTSDNIDIQFNIQVPINEGSSNDLSHQLYYGYSGAGSPPADPTNVLPPPKDANTVGLWHLSEGSGNSSIDLSGHGNNITSIGSLTWIDAGTFGNALSHNDPNSGPPGAYVPGNSSLSSTAFTYEAWVKRGPFSYGQLGAQGESNLQRERWTLMLEGGQLKFTVWPWPGAGASGVKSDSNFLPDSNWHHVAVTFDGGSTVRMYRDGVLMKTGSLAESGINGNNVNLYIGSGFQPSAERFYGVIDQVRLSNIVRTSFSHGFFANITNDPTVSAGLPIGQPGSGSPDLVLLELTTFPHPESGIIVQAVLQNQGDGDTLNGFYTDLYVDHLPDGTGDFGSSIQFWIDDPIEAGTTVTLTNVIEDVSALGRSPVQVAGAIDEVSATLYAQVDSSGVVGEPDDDNNIYSAGTEVCIADSDPYESDDTWKTATPLTLGVAQTHNVNKPGNEDWFAIQAIPDVDYVIRTANLGPVADTYIYLYGRDGQTLLDSNDDSNGTLASKIRWSSTKAGTYYVLVKHWNPNATGCGTYYDIRYTSTAPVVDFTAKPRSGFAPLKVQFTNLTTGQYETCLWNFGDGRKSQNCDNPVHTYNGAGEYDVTLTVDGSSGDDSKRRNDYIVVEQNNIYLPAILHRP